MASKSNGIDAWARAPPPAAPLCTRIANVIYNPTDGSILGRTPKRWGVVVIFYFTFYAVLALLFALCMGGLFLALEENKPVFTLDRSLIGVNPGVAYRPRPVDGFVMKLLENDTSDFYVTQLSDFLMSYQNESWYTSKTECSEIDSYGYPQSPCVYIKLNKIYGWKPEYYDITELPADMPRELVEYISGLQPHELQQIWVSCTEEQSNATKIEYPWGMGLSGRFYPYLNEEGYNSPLVAVKLSPLAGNTTVTVRCRAWAKNIIYKKSLKEGTGYTRIQIVF